MQTIISQTSRSLLILVLLLPVFTFAQSEPQTVEDLPTPPAFFDSIKTESDLKNLTPAQQEEIQQYFAEQIGNVTMKEASIVAEVNLQNIIMTSPKAGVFGISFELANGTGVQTGVKYSVSLIRETDQGQYVVDTKVYPEVLTLKEHSTIKKDITYTAPTGLNGTYQILVESKTDGGMGLGIGLAGEVTLAPETKGLEIINDTCYLQVTDEEGSPKYSLSQGVDITPEENLFLTCEVNNYAPSSASVIPFFETHFRTLYGEVVPQTGGSVDPIQFAGNEIKTVTMTLPMVTNPQAYDVKVTLKNENLETNSVVAHYVLVGASATIQNVILDKNTYTVGDTANISFVWSPSADGFADSRHGMTSPSATTLDISITSGGVDCIAPQNTTLDNTLIKQAISIPVTADCAYPLLSLSLKDVNGKVLDDSSLSPNGESPVVAVVPVSDDSSNSNKTLVLLGTVFFIIALVYAYIKRNSTNDIVEDVVLKSLLVLVMVGGMFMSGPGRVEAVTWSSDDSYGSPWSLVANIDKSKYTPGEDIYFTTTITSETTCGNPAKPYKLKIRNSPKPDARVFSFFDLLSMSIWKPIGSGDINWGGSVSLSAPIAAPTSLLGDYFLNANYTYNYGDDEYKSSRSHIVSIPYKLVAPPPLCVPISGTPCSNSNSCGDISSGTWDCTGTICSAPVMPQRAGWGSVCSSPANVCGLTYTGTKNVCTASSVACNKTIAPPNSDCPPVVSMSASPLVVDSGSNSKLTWNVSNAVSCVGTSLPSLLGWNSTPKTPSNSFEVVNPTGDVTYTLTCDSGTGNKATDSATVLHPSGSISASDCEIAVGDTSCDTYITWNSINFLGATLVTQTGTAWTSSAVNKLSPGILKSVNPTNDVFTLKDTGGSFVKTDSANTICTAGSVWADDTIGCLKLPELNVSVNQNLVRNGEVGKGSVSVLADYPLNCTIIAATEDVGGLSTFTHPGSASPVVYSFTTLPLTSAQQVQVECVHPSYVDAKDTKTARIDVTASVEER